jgi:long-chain acyl-CoA synthetase
VHKNVSRNFLQRASESADKPAVRFKEAKSGYQDMSWGVYAQLVRQIAFGLAAHGLEPGGTAAIFSAGTHLWIAADFAIIANGGKSTPIYPTSSQSDIEAILSNSEAKFVFVQDEKLMKKVLDLRDKLPHLKQIILFKKACEAKNWQELCQEFNLHAVADKGLITFIDELKLSGDQLAKEHPQLIDERMNDTKLDDPATIIYTSGTTGSPKGAVLTHNNIISIIEAIKPVLPIGETDVYLSYLPLSHVFERVCGQFYWASSGGVIAFAESIETMAKNLGEVEPTMLLVVPRVLDRIYTKVRSGITGASPRAQKLIEWAIGVGKEVVQAKSENKPLRLGLKLKLALSEKLVFRKLRERIGKRLRLVVSGGAPATPAAIEFFNAIGISTMEGYGLTETCAPSHVNRQQRVKIGTVGPALPSVEVKIAEDGEILMRGPSIVQSYFKNEVATNEAFKDGWFHTGDIGTVDGDGYLRITDRKKDLIINSAGKNIAPQRIEAIVKSIPNTSQAVVFGDKQKALVALITMDELATVEYARENNWNFQNYEDLSQSSELNNWLRKEIRLRSGQLADYEQVKKFRILPADLSVESGELTATLKVKRAAIAKKYASLIEQLYSEKISAEGDSELARSRR